MGERLDEGGSADFEDVPGERGAVTLGVGGSARYVDEPMVVASSGHEAGI